MRFMRIIILDVPLRLERLHRSQLGEIEERVMLGEACRRSFADGCHPGHLGRPHLTEGGFSEHRHAWLLSSR
jgi:hypothetical protein